MICIKARLHGRFLWRFFSFCMTHAIEWLSHKSIDLYIHLIACIKKRKIAAKIACVNGPLERTASQRNKINCDFVLANSMSEITNCNLFLKY